MEPGDIVGEPCPPHRIAGPEPIADCDIDRPKVRVAGPHATSVVHGYDQIVDHPAGERDRPRQHHADHCPRRNCIIGAPMTGEPRTRIESCDDRPGSGGRCAGLGACGEKCYDEYGDHGGTVRGRTAGI